MNYKGIAPLIEPAITESEDPDVTAVNFNNSVKMALLASTAISLRRIADALELHNRRRQK